MTWYANKTESKDIERIQNRATAWVLGSWETIYKDRLFELKRLPLKYYFELHDLTHVNSPNEKSCNIEFPIKPNENATNTRQK